MGHAKDVVDRFYEATNARRAQDLPALVAEDVTFVGPLTMVAGATTVKRAGPLVAPP